MAVDRNVFGGLARQLEARLTDYHFLCRRMGEEHSIVGDCMEDIRALSARLVALWETEDTDGEES
jgi:hypothetical protein